MNLKEFAEKINMLVQLMESQDRNPECVFVKISPQMFVHDIVLQDDGSGCDNLDVMLKARTR